MSVANQIIDYIAARLALIRAGYQINLYRNGAYTFQTSGGERVWLNGELGENPDELPFVVLFPGAITTTLDGAELGMQINTFELTIGGEIASDKAGSEGRALMTDITAALKSEPWFGGLIDEITAWNADVSVQVGDTVTAIVKITFAVTYTVPYGSE